MAIASASAIVVGVILYALSDWIANGIYDNPELVTPLRYVAFAVPPAAITMAALAACSGFGPCGPTRSWASCSTRRCGWCSTGSPSGRAPA